MKTAFKLLGLALFSLAIFFIWSQKHGNSKPAIYARLVVQRAENLFDNDTTDWAAYDIRLSPTDKSYPNVCRRAKTEKQRLSRHDMSAAGKAFETMLLDEIIPHWYGTAWDFDGHTDTPGQGKVACGYFVSTTLLHVGVNVNRYHLAQQRPENEARSLATEEGKVLEFSGQIGSEAIAKIKAAIGKGICFVGLDQSHVGYLLKRKDELFFIHSSYFAPGGVIVELVSKSPVFMAYDHFFIVELSNSPAFVKRWLNNEKIEVIKT